MQRLTLTLRGSCALEQCSDTSAAEFVVLSVAACDHDRYVLLMLLLGRHNCAALLLAGFPRIGPNREMKRALERCAPECHTAVTKHWYPDRRWYPVR